VKKFFVLWTSQVISILASSIVGFALVWYLTEKTGSATVLSTSMMVNYIPTIVLGPFIGPFIDRWNRKKIMIYSDIAQSLLSLALIVLFFINSIQIWHIYVVMAGYSIGRSFQGTALSTSIPMIVPEKQLARANGLNQTISGLINIIGPIAGALLLKAFPMQWILSVDVISTIILVSILLPLAIPQPLRTIPSVKPGYFSEMKQGFRYIVEWRGLLFLLILIAILMFFAAPINTLRPLFVMKYLGGDVLQFGWLMTAGSAGVVAGGLILSAWGGFKRRIITTLVSVMVQGMAIFVFGFTTESLFSLALAMVFITGFGSSIFNANVGAIIQSVVAKDMQGRVVTLQYSIGSLMIPLALAIAGPVTDAIGLRTVWYVAGGVIFALTAFSFFSSDLMKIEK
jgi:MFS transporter, DHA3 family, macrolide efflux protein